MLKKAIILFLPLGLSSCSSPIPNGPSVLVLPGGEKDYGQFHNDDFGCRDAAHAQIMMSPKPPESREEGQHRYDIDYIQCMYGKGHRVPVPQDLLYDTRDEWHPPPPPNLPPPQSTTP